MRLNASPSSLIIHSCLYTLEIQTLENFMCALKGGLDSAAEKLYNCSSKVCCHKPQSNKPLRVIKPKMRRKNSPVSNVTERHVVDKVLQQCC